MYDPHSSKESVRLSLIAVLYATSVVWGSVQALCNDTAAWNYLLSHIFAGAAAWWVAADASSRKRPVLHIVQLIIFFLWQAAVPVYLIKSRGWRGLGWAVLHTIGLFAAIVFGFYAALLLTA